MFTPVLTRTRLTVIVALFIAVTGNRAFFRHVSAVYPWDGNAVFLVSLAVLLFSILVLLVALFSLLLPVRVVAGVILVLSAITGYFSDHLGTVIDVGMIQNLLETNVSEASDLINGGMALRLLLLGILPAYLIWRLPFKNAGWVRELRFSVQTGLIALVLMMICIFPVSDQYASFIREHKMLRYYTNPATPIYSAGKYIASALKVDDSAGFMRLTANAATIESDGGHELIIVVVGETARADHFSLNGYRRITNPRLAREGNLVSYSHVSSCGTDTAISVPCLFSFDGRAEFDIASARRTENVLDVLAKAGVNVLWRDNNSDSKGVAERVQYEDYRSNVLNPDCDVECRDVGMLSGLQDYIDSHEGDILIVLHQMGSHGPAYSRRYPPEFEEFRPACHTRELSECTREEITNAYDNSLLYTDYFVSKVIELLKENTPNYETAMFYVGDHGESLGENGLYLHGMPYMFAPAAQTHVPLIAWIGRTSDIDYAHTLTLRDVTTSHDSFSSSLLEAFEVDAEYFEKPGPVARLIYMKQGDDAH